MKKDVITLEKITYKNYVKVLFGLNVNRKQKEFVASNMCSLAEAYVALTNGYPPYPFAICRNGKPVGFLMIGQRSHGRNRIKSKEHQILQVTALGHSSGPADGLLL